MPFPSSHWARSGTGPVAAALGLLGALAAAVLGLATFAFPPHASAAPAAASAPLVGTLRLTPGSCSGGTASGTYFRMILPSGTAHGPYLSNSDSKCGDQSLTPLAAGSDGGLRVGSYQPSSTPRFSANGDARAHRITAPAAFYGTSFATATSPVDPQTRRSVPAPRVTVSGSRLTADLRSFAVTWNNQDFNQGAPKPDGTTPGNTALGTGTYDASTGAFTLNWASQIVGGPFDKFTGSWHFEGRFVPAGASSPSGHAATSGSGSTGGGTTGSGAGTSTGAVPAPGAPVTPAKAPRTTGKPATTAGQPAAVPILDPAPSTTVTKIVKTDQWRVSWPVVGLAVGIGLLAIGALVLSSVLSRRTESP